MNQLNRYEKGIENIIKLSGEQSTFHEVKGILKDISPRLSDLFVSFAFGDVYSGEELTLQQRELLTISILVTQGGCDLQLKAHTESALKVGCSKEEIIETIIHLWPYIGFPKVLNGMLASHEVIQKVENEAA